MFQAFSTATSTPFHPRVFLFSFLIFFLLFRARISTVANSGIYLLVYIALIHQEIPRYTASRCRYYYIGNNSNSWSFSLAHSISIQFSFSFILSLFHPSSTFLLSFLFLHSATVCRARHNRQLLVSLLMKSNRLRPSTSR